MNTNTSVKDSATGNVPRASGEPEPIGEGSFYVPSSDVAETNQEFVLEIDLPGVKAGDVDLTCEAGVLTLYAKVKPRQTSEVQFIRQEYGVGSYRRVFQISDRIDSDQIRAQMKNGVLTLTIPKLESRKARKISIATE